MTTTIMALFIGAWTGTISYFVAILMSVAAEADERDEIEARTIPSDIDLKMPERE